MNFSQLLEQACLSQQANLFNQELHRWHKLTANDPNDPNDFFAIVTA